MGPRRALDFRSVPTFAEGRAGQPAPGPAIVGGDAHYLPAWSKKGHRMARDVHGVARSLQRTAKAKNPCTRTILSEGTCQFLATHSKYICCDPDNGYDRPGRKADIDGNACPREKFTPIFTCDSKCDKALERGCDDDDNWMAIPPGKFTRSKCDDVYTICANGRSTTGYVRDNSSSQVSYEVSPGIQKALGVPLGSSFLGSIYRPGAKQASIDDDRCCAPEG